MNSETASTSHLAVTGGADGLQQARYHSRALGIDRKYAYYLPHGAAPDSGDKRYPLLVLLHGRGGGFLDWPTKTRLLRYLGGAGLIVVFPDGGDGWYTNAVGGGGRYEDDLMADLLPHLQETLPVCSPGRRWGIGGMSMGGFGAVKLALKYSETFSIAVSHGGSLDKARTPEVHPVFGDPQKDIQRRLAEDPAYLAEQALCRFPVIRPKILLDCGLQDDHLGVNRRFSGHLTFIGYAHTYSEMPGHHTWPYWNRAMRATLPAVMEHLGVS